jgi:sarcosine oxidase, subunit beta
MKLPKTAQVVVIGGGVMGASTAYHLAARGVKDVVLLEKEEFFGTGATGRCAGGVRYQFSTEVNVQLSLASLPMLEHFEEEFGQAIDYNQVGYLMLLTNEKDLETFRNNVELQHNLGVMTEWLDGDDVRRRVPILQAEDVIAATNYPKDGTVDPNGVVMGYIRAAQRLGVTTLTETTVTGIGVENGRVTGVETPSGSIATPKVVNASGPWASIIGQMAGIPIPISPLRRQWLTTTALPDLPPDFPFVIDFAQSLYFHPEGDGLLTGMSNSNEEPGFSQNIDPDWELVHMEAAIKRLPMLETAGMSSRLAGLYENTPDAHPIYGATSLEGFYIVSGFSGHGFMHGPISGLLMAEIILDGAASTVDVSMLDLARFEEGRTIQEYNVI